MPLVGLMGRLAIALAVAGHVPAFGGEHLKSSLVHDDPRRFLRAYPVALKEIKNGVLVWRDGSRMPLITGTPARSVVAAPSPEETGLTRMNDAAHRAWLAAKSLSDMLRQPYRTGKMAGPPERNHDPGRARHMPFFKKMYGDCRNGEVRAHLEAVRWLPERGRGTIRVTRINGVAARLRAVSAELAKLPRSFDRYLMPASGGFNCRQIAGTNRLSAHAFGIAVDIAIAPADYWRWAQRTSGSRAEPLYRNRVPIEIVDIFERHGFIWGGKWFHFDTMHFEFRPELLPVSATATP